MMPMLNTNTLRMFTTSHDSISFQEMFRHKIFLRNTLTLENSKSKFTASPPLLRERPVLLRGVADDHANDAAGQDDLEIVAVLHIRNQESQYKANRHTKTGSPKVRIHLSSKDARSKLRL